MIHKNFLLQTFALAKPHSLLLTVVLTSTIAAVSQVIWSGVEGNTCSPQSCEPHPHPSVGHLFVI